MACVQAPFSGLRQHMILANLHLFNNCLTEGFFAYIRYGSAYIKSSIAEITSNGRPGCLILQPVFCL